MIVILGGGLSGSLLAYRIAQLDHPPDFLLIESQERLGGSHTWSFHETDLGSASLMSWVSALISRSWPNQDVRFRGFKRSFSNPYHTIKASGLDRVVQSRLGNRLLLNESVDSISSKQVILKSGRVIEATVIFDARGLNRNSHPLCGYQKFVGMDLELDHPHGLKHPVIMDVNCEQKDGYRFFYLLPWTSRSILVEDTRYSSNPAIDLEDFQSEIRSYCEKSNFKIQKEIGKEIGCLPIPFRSFQPQLPQLLNDSEVVPIGLRGGYFHWTTGYSFPLAVQVAEAITQELKKNSFADKIAFDSCLKRIQDSNQKQARFFSLLNRMLFLAGEPSNRWKIFQRFYGLHEDLIFRFYKGDLRTRDMARILLGRPPVPVLSALNSILNFKTYEKQQGQISSDLPSSW